MNGESRDRRLEVRDQVEERYVENDLIRWMRLGADAVRPYLTTIAAVAAALLIVWGYFAWRKASNDARCTAAWNEFFAEDYDTVISKYQDTDAARYARMRIAANAIQEGKNLLMSKRGEAINSFEKAQQQLDTVASDAEAPIDMRRSAAYLKGVALEASGAPERAKEQYTKVATQYRDSFEGQQAERRVKELSRPSASDFYRQLANYKPGDRPTMPKPVRNSDLDELLRGLGGNNPNLPGIPTPPKSDVKTSDAKDIVPPPPPKKTSPPVAAPGKDLPENDEKSSKEAPKSAPAKTPEPNKK